MLLATGFVRERLRGEQCVNLLFICYEEALHYEETLWDVRRYPIVIPIYTTKKLESVVRISLYSCRLWKDLQIKLKFSQDISYISISNLCEKQIIPNDATLIVQKPLFDPKIQNQTKYLISCFLDILIKISKLPLCKIELFHEM